jgi:hypothetical protein
MYPVSTYSLSSLNGSDDAVLHLEDHVFVLCPSSDVSKNRTFRNLDLFPSSGKIMMPYSVGSLQRLTLAPSKGPNRVGAAIILPEDGN